MVNKNDFLTDKAVKLMTLVVFLSLQTESAGNAEASLTLLEHCVPLVLFPCAPVSLALMRKRPDYPLNLLGLHH